MRKIVVSLCLLYAANSCAMAGAGKIIGLATMPFTVPGAYYACKTIMDQKKVAALDNDSPEFKGMSAEQREREKHVLMLNANSFLPYMDSVALGFAPVINIFKLIGSSKEEPSVSKMRADTKVGFFAGLALWPNLVLAMSLLKKVK